MVSSWWLTASWLNYRTDQMLSNELFVSRRFSQIDTDQMLDMLQRLLQKSTSHSPQALAWGQCSFEAENRFNGLYGNIEDFGAASETVKTVAEIQRRAVTPG